MKTLPMANKHSNPDVKRAIILFPRPKLRNLERGQFHTYKLHTTSADATLPVYKLSIPFFDEGSPEDWIKAEIAQGNQIVPHFNNCLYNVAEHVFPEKA
eukprot:1113637-Ditylum_brightwellii.AAC.1